MTQTNAPKTVEAYEPIVTPEPEHPKKSIRVANFVALTALVIIGIAIGVYLKLAFASTNILEVYNNPFPARIVADPGGQTGGIVFLKIDYCKKEDLGGQVRMSYISKSREILLPLAKEQMPKSCGNQEVPVVIPRNLLRDTYKIKFHVIYDINPLKQNIILDFESQPFMVGTNKAD